MALVVPSEETNAEAVKALLQESFSLGSKPVKGQRPWEKFLRNVNVPSMGGSKKKGSKKKDDEDEVEVVTPSQKFNKIAMSTGLQFMFLMMNSNLELKHDVLVFFSSMLRTLDPLDFQGLDKVQSASLDQLEHYLAESITKDVDLQDLAHGFFNRMGSVLANKEEKGNQKDVLDLLVALVNVRGSLSTNVLLARILATKPDLLTSKSLAELRKITSFSHPWLRPEPGSVEELVVAWREIAAPKLKRKFSADPPQAAKKLAEVEKMVRQERTEEATEALNAILREGEEESSDAPRQPALANLPTRASLALARESKKFAPVAEQVLSSLESKLAAGQTCDKLEACSAILSLLDLIADRAMLPPSFSKKDLKGLPLPHLIGNLGHMRSICDLLLAIPSEVLVSCSADNPAASIPCYTAVVQGVISMLRLNLEWLARRVQSGISLEPTEEDREVFAIVEKILRSVILQEGDYAGAFVLGGERGRVMAADAYSIGMPYFFNSPKAILAVLEPLMEQVKEDTTTNSPLRLFCSTIVSRISRADLLFSLLKTEEEDLAKQQGASAAGEDGKSGQLAGALAPMLDALVAFVVQETHNCRQSGVPPNAMWAQLHDPQDADGGGDEGEVEEEWIWATYNRGGISTDHGGLGCTKYGGDHDYSVALGSVGFSEGTHKWEIKILNQRSMLAGVGPSTSDVDRCWSPGMVGWHNDGAIRGPNEETMANVPGYEDGEVLTLVLDFEENDRGNLEFWSNGKKHYTAHSVVPPGATEVFPMVQFDYDDRILVRKQVVVTGAADRSQREHLPVACAGIATSTLALLASEIDAGSASVAMYKIGASVCACLLNRLCSLLDLFSVNGGLEADKTLLPAFDGLLGYSSSGVPRHLLGFFPLAALVTHKIFTKSSVSGGDLTAQGLSITCLVDAVTKLHSFVESNPELGATYGGRCFRSFDLQGIQLRKPDQFENRMAEIALVDELPGPWTLEILAKRTKESSTEEGCANTLVSFEGVDLFLGTPTSGRGAQVVLTDAEKETVDKFEKQKMPIGAWVSLCLVNTGEVLQLYIDGTFAGSVERTFPLVMVSVGGEDEDESFVGLVRRLRIWNRALLQDEAALLVTEGEDAVSEGWVATIDLVRTVSTDEENQATKEKKDDGSATASEDNEAAEPCGDVNFRAVRGACTSKFAEDDETDSKDETPLAIPEDVIEPHWLLGLTQTLNGVAAARATSMVRGKRQTEEDAACSTWIKAPVFQQGIGAQILEPEALATAQTTASGVFDQLVMPKFGIRLSPVLDAMERVIIVTALHHCGVLKRAMTVDRSKWPASLVATSKNIAQAARGVRRHVQTRRDLANQALKENEDPQPWEVFCEPIVAKCRLLLRVPSMCSVEESLAAKTALAASAFAEAGKAKAVATAASAFKRKGLEALQAHAVYKRMWSQGLGKSREKKVMDGMQGFLKDDEVSPEQMLKVAELLMGHVSEVQEGLAALVALMQKPEQLRKETLEALARSENAHKHYLDDLAALGKAVEDDVRSSFHRLTLLLIDVLQAKPMDPETVACAAFALRCKLDRPDLSEVLSSNLMDAIDQLLSGESKAWQGWGEALPSLTRLLSVMMLQVGVHAQRLEAAKLDRVMASAFSVMQEATKQSALSPEWEYWLNTGEEDILYLSLYTELCGVSVQNPVKGTAIYHGEDYTVQGFIATEGDYRLTLEREGAEAVRLTGKTSASMTPSPTNPNPEHRNLNLKAAAGSDEGAEEEEIELFKVFCKPGSAPEFTISDSSITKVFDSLVTTRQPCVVVATQPITPENNYIQIQLCGVPTDDIEEGQEAPFLELGVTTEAFDASSGKLGRSEDLSSMCYALLSDEVLFGERSRLDEKEDGSQSSSEALAGADQETELVQADDTLSCRVIFKDGAPETIEWRVNGELKASHTGCPPSMAGQPLRFAVHAPAFRPLVASTEVDEGGEPARNGIRKSGLMKETVRRLLDAMRHVGHTPAMKRALAKEEWREALWALVAASGLDDNRTGQRADVSARSNALKVLAFALDGGAMSDAEVTATVKRVLSLLVSLSPEARILDFMPAPDALEAHVVPCLALRQQLSALLIKLGQDSKCQSAVSAALVSGLKSEAVQPDLLASVLAVGGALDQVVGVGKPESSKNTPAFGIEVVKALLDACKRALAKRESSDVDACVVRTRMLKAVWELSACGSVQALFADNSDAELRTLIIALAQTRSSVPIMVGVGAEPSAAPAPAARLQRLTTESMEHLTEEIEGVEYMINCRSMFLDQVLQPGSGKYYAEFTMQQDFGEYFFVGVGTEECSEMEPLGNNHLGWSWANDGDFKTGGGWNSGFMDRDGAECTANIESGQHVGVLVDMDTMEIKFYRDGQYVGAIAPGKIESCPLRIGVGSSSQHKVRLIEKSALKWTEGAQYARGAGGAGGGSSASGPWLTMEAMIAKSHALCIEVGTNPAISAALKSEPLRSDPVPVQDPLARLLGTDQLGSTLKWSRSSGESAKPLDFPTSKEDLLPKSKVSKGKDKAAPAATSSWPSTRGNKAKLLLDTENALSINYSRLIVLQLLQAGVAPLALSLTAQDLLNVILPFFPPGVDDDRPLFRSGPFASLVPLLDEALVGWIQERGQHGASGQIVHELKQLTSACLAALQREALANRLIGQGVTGLGGVMPGGFSASPSVVTWVMPKRWPITTEMPGSEKMLRPSCTIGLAGWLSRHLFKDYGLGGRSECSTDLGSLMEGLLEALSLARGADTRKKMQDALSIAIPHCGPQAAAGWGKRVFELLRVLRRQMLAQLQKEVGGDEEKRVLFSPLLQSLAATVIAADLAANGMKLRAVVEGFKEAASLEPSADTTCSISPTIMEHLAAFGYSENHVQMALKLLGQTTITQLEDAKGMELLNKLAESDEEEMTQQLQQRKSPDGSGPEDLKMLTKVQALAVMSQVLRCMQDAKPLPVSFVDMCKTPAVLPAEVNSWDDRDSRSGMLVSGGCQTASLRPSVAPGEWGSVIGNAPLTAKTDFVAIRVGLKRKHWAESLQDVRFAGTCVGIMLVDGDLSASVRSAVAKTGFARACVVVRAMAQSITICDGAGHVTTEPLGCRFTLGSTVGIYLNKANQMVEFFIQQPGSDTMERAGSAKLPLPSLAAVPIFSTKSSEFKASFVNMERPESCARASASPGLLGQLSAFPARNTVTLSQLGWDDALDPEWSKACDALLVEFAVKYAADNKRSTAMPLTGKELFPEKKDDDVTLALERQTSRLPPAVRAASYLSNPSSGTFINRKPQQHGNEAPNLSKMRPSVLRARWSVIKALNQTAEQAIELVDLRRFEEEGSIAHILCMSKALLLPEMKTKLFDKSVALTAGPDNPPEIHLNRGTSPAESRKRERTILWQMMHVVEEQKISFTRIGGPGDSKQAWLTRFEGEGGMDYGGLYRDSLREMCAELQCQGGSLQLFLPCPNQRMATGSCQDRWLPNPLCTSQLHLRLYRFVGMLMGASIRTDACIELDLPGMVWKQLVGEECLREDVAAVDEVWNKDVQNCLGAETKQEWDAKARMWVVKSFTGRTDELVPGGAQKKVEWEEREAFVEAQVQMRINEFRAQVAAIQEGFSSVIPGIALPLLTWRELERRVCGTAIIDVDILEKTTEYQGSLSAEHPLAVKFWKVVKTFSQADLAALLAFVWGRKRMPVPNSGDHMKIDMLGRGDNYLPQAHTCFFAVDLPEYSTESVLKEKLMYAIYGCAAIDNDNGNPNGTLYESDEESEAEESAIENLDVIPGSEVKPEGDVAVNWLVLPLDCGDEELEAKAAAEGIDLRRAGGSNPTTECASVVDIGESASSASSAAESPSESGSSDW